MQKSIAEYFATLIFVRMESPILPFGKNTNILLKTLKFTF